MKSSAACDDTTLFVADQAPGATLDEALALAAMGYRVFPCHSPYAQGCSCGKPDCGDIGKHPRITQYQKNATRNPKTIRAYWKRWPDANIGLLTGTTTGLLVLDEDPYRGGDIAALETQYGPLPSTPHVLTGGRGTHFFFSYPDIPGLYIPSGRDVLGPGLDIRADGGGLVITPPSLHASGRRYEWEVCHNLKDMPPAPLPLWMLAPIGAKFSPTAQAPKKPGSFRQGDSLSKTPPKGGVSLLTSAAGVGNFPLPPRQWRSHALTALFGHADVLARCLPLCGLEGIAVGKKFLCIVHPEESPSAEIRAPRVGHEHDTYVYMDYHGTDREVWPLPVIYWALKTGRPPEKLSKSSLVTWTLRLLVDAGVLSPAPIRHLPPLPENAPAEAHTVYNGFRHLLGCRWLYKEDVAPFTLGFGSDWCGVGTEAIDIGRKWLLRAGYLYPMRKRGNMWLFLLGSVDRIRRLAGRVTQAARHMVETIGEVITKRVRTWHRTMSPTPPGGPPTTALEQLHDREARLQAAKVAHGDCRGCTWCEISLPTEERTIDRLRQQLECAHGPP